MSAMKVGCLLAVCCLVLAGCGGGDDKPVAKPNNAATTSPTKQPEPTEKVQITDVKVGEGPRKVEKGDQVWVTYKGTLKNGTEFDSNTDESKEPYWFTVGENRVIKGWEQGILGMKVGGERKLVIPPSLGYGDMEQAKVPANSELHFDIKLLCLVKAGEDNVIDTKQLKPGTGTRVVKPGDKVSIELKASLVNGRVVQDTKGQPVEFTVGKTEVVPSIDKGVQGMKAGEVREIIAPPLVAYANTSSTGVPANSPIIFKVTLVGFK